MESVISHGFLVFWEMVKGGIYWCLNCNSPLLGEKCNECEDKGEFVPLSRAADARPAFNNDVAFIENLIRRTYGNRVAKTLNLKNQMFLLNRLPYLDKAYEIVLAGKVLAHIFFDIFSLSWKIKPLKALLKFMEEAATDHPHIILNKEKIGKHELLDESDIKKSNINESTEYFGIYSKDNKLIGLGCKSEGKILVLRVWKNHEDEELSFKKKSSWKTVLKANRWQIEASRSRACKFLGKTVERFRREVFVSYSGGKDSLACLLLSLQAGLDPKMLFIDTCLEMPETIRNVNLIVEKFGLDSYVGKAEIGRFWKKFYAVGPPARDFRWCSQLCKLKPTNKVLSKLGETLCIVGQRRVESSKRASSPDVWLNPYVKKSINVTPISGWKALHIWLFIMSEKAESLVNELYFKGFDRVGCYMCPSATLADMYKVKEWHPKLWSKWEEALKEWGMKNSLNENWIKYALWRWRKRIPKTLKAFLEK